MTPFEFSHISAWSIAIPLFLVGVKRKCIGRKYFPLVLLLLVGAVNEALSYTIIMTYGTNMMNSNIYLLVEYVLIIWMFRRWPSDRNNDFLLVLLGIGISVWVFDNLVIHSLFSYNSWFGWLGSMILIYASIDRINLALFNDQRTVIPTKVLICIGLLLYHIYNSFTEAFQVFHITLRRPFFETLLNIHSVVNIITHILYSIAFLCLRCKTTSTLLSIQR